MCFCYPEHNIPTVKQGDDTRMLCGYFSLAMWESMVKVGEKIGYGLIKRKILKENPLEAKKD